MFDTVTNLDKINLKINILISNCYLNQYLFGNN
jgi:hypothetical protein